MVRSFDILTFIRLRIRWRCLVISLVSSQYRRCGAAISSLDQNSGPISSPRKEYLHNLSWYILNTLNVVFLDVLVCFTLLYPDKRFVEPLISVWRTLTRPVNLRSHWSCPSILQLVSGLSLSGTRICSEISHVSQYGSLWTKLSAISHPGFPYSRTSWLRGFNTSVLGWTFNISMGYRSQASEIPSQHCSQSILALTPNRSYRSRKPTHS